MYRMPTWGQIAAFFCLIAGVVCLVVAAITSAIIAVGWSINWMIPSLSFDSACIVAGIACAFTGFVLRGAAKLIFVGSFGNHSTIEDDDDEDEDDDDYLFDEEMADRIAELTVAKLSRPTVEKKYTAKARRK